ncbi:Serine/threonine-protein phosphatase [Fusarium sp. Ph1]|nr:Serine/threonine-protein phosphatase [Fusarium sp. Ph1]
MSTSFLSRQDIESWVPDATASRGGVDLVTRLSTGLSRSMDSLRTALVGIQDETCRMAQNELERFLLWCQGLGVADGRLDEVLSQSTELHHQVLSLLLRLGTAVLQAMSQVPGEALQSKLDDYGHLRTLLDVVEAMFKDSDSDEHERPDTPPGSDVSDHELVETMEEISAYVDCLLDLAPALDNPVLDIQGGDSEEAYFSAKELFTTSCEEALIYCRKIRDRFEALPRYLVERLAEANVVRAAKLREMRRQVIEQKPPFDASTTESLFSDKYPHLTQTTKSSVPPPVRVLVGPGPLLKTATFAFFSTAASSIAMGRPRIPPMPVIQEGGFDCTVCLLRLTNITTRKQWKSSKCEFCSANYRELGPAFYKHVSGHLREVSLSVLPRMIGHDDESDTDVTNDTDTGSLPRDLAQEGSEEDHSLPPAKSTAGVFRTHQYPELLSTWDFDPNHSPEAPFQPGAMALRPGSPTPSTGVPVTDQERVDGIIDRLLEARNLRAGTPINLLSSDVNHLCNEVKEIFLSEPTLLHLKAPLTVVGDIRGQFNDLLKVFNNAGLPPKTTYLFLGNYVDYGTQSLEVICLLIAYKIKYPNHLFLLRGSHQIAKVNHEYGFYLECKRRQTIQVWEAFVGIFDCLPLVAIVDEKVFCVHGGLSPDLKKLEDIKNIVRPTDVPDRGLLHDLLWSDPLVTVTGWGGYGQGVPGVFGPGVVSEFLAEHDLDLILRGHQAVGDGYQYFADQKLVTLWTAPNWQGFGHAGAILTFQEKLVQSITTII